MRNIFFWATAIIVFGVINGLIVQKQLVLADGQTVFLQLVPVDPRSLIQGDYMMLRYSPDTLPPEETVPTPDGRIVVKLDENFVGTFKRFYGGEALSANEVLLRYRKRGDLRLGRDSFFIQEGTGDIYSKAKYAELKVDRSGESILVGLRDEQFAHLRPVRK